MQYTLTISQTKALEWGLNAQQALLFAFVYECPSWCRPISGPDGVFYALSKAKIVEELPLLTDKPDTAYRLLKQLQDAGVIELSHTRQITLVRVTDKGRTWNRAEDGSEKFPSTSDESPIHVGKISEPARKKIRASTEKSPTNQETINQGTNQETKSQTCDVQAVFDHWRVKMSSPRSKMDSNRRTLITNALKLYPAEVLKLAIDGCAGSSFHMGKNDTGKKYNGLDLILRNAEKIDGFVARAEAPEKSGKTGYVAFDTSTQNYQGTPDDEIAEFLL